MTFAAATVRKAKAAAIRTINVLFIFIFPSPFTIDWIFTSTQQDNLTSDRLRQAFFIAPLDCRRKKRGKYQLKNNL